MSSRARPVGSRSGSATGSARVRMSSGATSSVTATASRSSSRVARSSRARSSSGPISRRPSAGPGRDPGGLGADEVRCERHGVLGHDDMDAEVVPVDPPAPGLVALRVTPDPQPVAVAADVVLAGGELPPDPFGGHHSQGEGGAGVAVGGHDQLLGAAPLLVGEVLDRQAGAVPRQVGPLRGGRDRPATRPPGRAARRSGIPAAPTPVGRCRRGARSRSSPFSCARPRCSGVLAQVPAEVGHRERDPAALAGVDQALLEQRVAGR